MAINNLVVANPFLNEHIKLVEEYEKENNQDLVLSNMLKKINKTDEETYKKEAINSNELNLVLFQQENNKITDICNIQCSRDIKTCTIFLTPNKNIKNRNILKLVSDYAFNVLGMEEIFITTMATDKDVINTLEKQNFENLGEENGNITFLKENIHENKVYNLRHRY